MAEGNASPSVPPRDERPQTPLKRLLERIALTPDQAERLAQIKFPCC